VDKASTVKCPECTKRVKVVGAEPWYTPHIEWHQPKRGSESRKHLNGACYGSGSPVNR
jgi:hypothetical protein